MIPINGGGTYPGGGGGQYPPQGGSQYGSQQFGGASTQFSQEGEHYAPHSQSMQQGSMQQGSTNYGGYSGYNPNGGGGNRK
jgi:hypothetical protein